MTGAMPLARVRALRLLAAIRAQASTWPGLVLADDGARYVVKWRGGAEGPGLLAREALVGALLLHAGLRGPRLLTVDVDAALVLDDRDAELADLVARSHGVNLGAGYLEGAAPYAPSRHAPPPVELAAQILAFDAFVLNVDRTPVNPNLLVHDGALVCIDHGAARFDVSDDLGGRLAQQILARHVFAQLVPPVELGRARARLAARLGGAVLRTEIAELPATWLGEGDPAAARRVLLGHVERRLAAVGG